MQRGESDTVGSGLAASGGEAGGSDSSGALVSVELFYFVSGFHAEWRAVLASLSRKSQTGSPAREKNVMTLARSACSGHVPGTFPIFRRFPAGFAGFAVKGLFLAA